jgi:hypothetical protein
MAPELRQSRLIASMVKQDRRHGNLQALRGDCGAHGVIVGQHIGKASNPPMASRVSRRRAMVDPMQGWARPCASAKIMLGVCWKEIIAAPICSTPRIAAPDIEAGRQPHARLGQSGGDGGEIVRLHHHIAVREDQYIVFGQRHHRCQIADLAIGAGLARPGIERDIGAGMAGHQPFDGGAGRVLGRVDAADHLHRRVMILRQKCRQIGGQLRLGAIERLEQSHRLGLRGLRRGLRKESPDRMDQRQLIRRPYPRKGGERNTDGLYPGMARAWPRRLAALHAA